MSMTSFLVCSWISSDWGMIWCVFFYKIFRSPSCCQAGFLQVISQFCWSGSDYACMWLEKLKPPQMHVVNGSEFIIQKKGLLHFHAGKAGFGQLFPPN